MSVPVAPRRVLFPGTSRSSARFTVPDESITVLSLSGPLAAQEYLQHLLEKGADASVFCELPPSIEAPVWMFENVRQFVTELNGLTVSLLPSCTAATCPTMNATDEWQYLCAAHRTPKECCAIDYIVHTLDGTAAILSSDKAFPSRKEIPGDCLQYFQSTMRRLYRIFSHAYFHHRDVFAAFEAKHHSCQRFVAFSRAFNLMPDDQFIVPPSAY